MMNEKLMELKMKSEEMKSVKETLLCWVKEEVSKGSGPDGCHVETTGAVVDMIKDFSEAEKDCAEAAYYMIVSSAMLNGDHPSYEENMGYNHRHLNNGRFASSGRGHMVSGHHSGSAGFHGRPFVDQEEYIDGYLHDPNFIHKMSSMGYTPEFNRMGGQQHSSKYGEAYDDYHEARRHYTESKDPTSKEEMNRHAMRHVNNTLESLQEMWSASDDVALKKRIMEDMTKVLNHMKTTM